MATIVTRAGKGSALSFAEVDGNFTNLNTDKLEKSGGTMTGAITFAAGQTWPTFNQNTTGNAATATALQTPRTINGVSFDGTGNITVADATKLPLAGGTMTGAITFAGGQTFPGTGDVTLTGSQTLTNKTLTAPVLTTPTINDGYTEEVFAVSGTTPALAATNGSIQTWTLTANSTPTDSISNGQSILLGVTAGSFTVTWPTTTWSKVGGSGTAPTLTSTGVNWIVFWKVGGTLRGALLGTA